jgi:predicted transcriptional regulator
MASIANHLKGKGENCKKRLEVPPSSLLKSLPLASFGNFLIDFIFKSYSRSSQQSYSKTSAYTFRVPLMRRSKMEMYVSTLEALAYYGPLKITKITYKAKMSYGQLKAILDDLIQKKLVEERTLKKNKVLYAVTPKARTILSYFEELKEMLPIAEDYNPHF